MERFGVFTEYLINFLDSEGVFDVCATATDVACKTPLDYTEELAYLESQGEFYYDGRWEESLKSLNAAFLSRYNFFPSDNSVNI